MIRRLFSIRTTRIAILIAVMVTIKTAAVSASWNAGSYLKYGVGARALGMGNSFVAVADDATAIYWNPAGLSQGTRPQAFLSSADRFGLGIQDQSLGLTTPWGKRTHVGFAVVRFGLDGIKKSPERGNEDDRPIVTGTFSNTEYALFFTTAVRIHRLLSLGITGKFFGHELDTQRASGWGIDLGWMFYPMTGLTVGLNAQNLNRPRINWNTGGGYFDRIAANFKFGAAYQVFPSKLRLTADLNVPDFEIVTVNTGAEYSPIEHVAMRGGVTQSSFSTGASIDWERFRLDYAYRTHDLGDTHRFALIVGF